MASVDYAVNSNDTRPQPVKAEREAGRAAVPAGAVREGGSSQAFVMGEDFAGMRSQALGLAVRAGWRGVFCPICPDRVTRLALSGPRWLNHAFLRGLDGRHLHEHEDLAASDVVISIGGKGGALGAALGEHPPPGRRERLPIVQVQHPRLDLGRFDLVVACRHDDITGDNVLVGRTALHGLTRERLEEAKALWAPRFAHLPRPLVAVLVGGSNGRYTFGVTEAARLGRVLVETVRAEGGSLLVTPSRRTDPAALRILGDAVQQVGGFVWDGEGENPYVGLIACADSLVVTMDSVSMMSEAVAGFAPVTVFPLPGRSTRISTFVEEMELAGRVRVLEADEARLQHPWPVTPLDDTPELVEEMHRRLGF
jgi:mitochondrial fission protein ELM1